MSVHFLSFIQNKRCVIYICICFILDKGKSGILNIKHHKCMSTDELYRMGKLGKHGCEDITEDLLSSMYKMSPTEAFETVGKLSGELCLCKSGLCNLPEKKEKKSIETSGADMMMPSILVLSIVLCLSY